MANCEIVAWILCLLLRANYFLMSWGLSLKTGLQDTELKKTRASKFSE